MTDAKVAIGRHLAAIGNRDLAAYSVTLHDEVTVILPNGGRLSGRDEVADFHREFFADKEWAQDVTELSFRVSGGTAVAVYEADYRGSADGQPIRKRFLLTLVFVAGDSGWVLLHDQCTPLPD
ncbi:YybH family protein [Actinomadura hibisca]|uniref:YybH family protein n=1 Tax=Actinomadura hibisca TaxID=68565 RepID=UPI00082A1DA4|nr:nuclear transport factor 2 family protein [Actinomadura hibisca]